jgi:hypothetical protein
LKNNLIVSAANLPTLKSVLTRGKPPALFTNMRHALDATDQTKSAVVAIDFQALQANESLSEKLAPIFGPNGLNGLGGFSQQLRNIIALSCDASLNSSRGNFSFALLCSDAKSADNLKKMIEAGQIMLQSAANRSTPQAALDAIKSLKLSLSGATLKGSFEFDQSGLLKQPVDGDRGR